MDPFDWFDHRGWPGPHLDLPATQAGEAGGEVMPPPGSETVPAFLLLCRRWPVPRPSGLRGFTPVAEVSLSFSRPILGSPLILRRF